MTYPLGKVKGVIHTEGHNVLRTFTNYQGFFVWVDENRKMLERLYGPEPENGFSGEARGWWHNAAAIWIWEQYTR